ncbi:sensor histidine kinase [Pseudomonas palmensis]|uniref:sensor histidine kinase n=1 Tax=Pseudomonas palmensis TaxID=2815362 RepID=UPI003CE7DB0E
MSLPGRHSLLWKLCALLVVLCLSIIWFSRSGGAHLERRSYHLSEEARQVLKGYAVEAHAAWRSGGTPGVDRWLADLKIREPGWALVMGSDLRSLSSQTLTDEQQKYVTFMRELDWPMSKRSPELPAISVPFPEAPQAGRLVIQLPERFMPSMRPLLVQLLIHGLLPALLALLAGFLLYRVLIGPLAHLRAQANALRADRLDTRVDPAISRRSDELGDLGRAFDHMAERLEKTVSLQQRLLADLSHELRTPLTRLHMAAENEPDDDVLRERLTREVQCMRQLVDDTLELVWLGTERPQLALDTVEVQTLWEVVRENACFESGWREGQLPMALTEDCLVRGHLNGLAQAMENIVRNAIRHSPANGQVRLGGRRDGDCWHLWIDDQGPGVAEAALETIFQPFTRLDAARPGGDGFGLGLTIARCRVQLQGGQVWAQNLKPGLRVNLRLPAAAQGET